MRQHDDTPTARPHLTRDDVIRVLGGQVADHTIAAIIATGATPEELLEAYAWATGQSDVMGEVERPRAGAVGQVYEILTADEEEPEDERR
ncbi:MAG: hypothetical protein HY521_03325 [Proteobacteria bacterium]|nr:hypothetical protein [Pseudomonadota bacterium]